jgi:hypothetical protein
MHFFVLDVDNVDNFLVKLTTCIKSWSGREACLLNLLEIYTLIKIGETFYRAKSYIKMFEETNSITIY